MITEFLLFVYYQETISLVLMMDYNGSLNYHAISLILENPYL